MINMAVAVNLFPVTGQTLPLVSMGGTSIWFTSIAIGIILSISRMTEIDTHNGTEVEILMDHNTNGITEPVPALGPL
jgi:cell division protein FtsW